MCGCSVRISRCCCCSLFLATVLTLVYLFVFYAVSLGLSSWALAKTVAEAADGKDHTYYETCLREVQRGESYERVYDDQGNSIVVRDVSDTPYFCSLGLYFEEIKFDTTARFPILIIDILVYVLLLLSIVLFVIGMVIRNQWLLLPLIIMFAIDIFRGFISTFFIFGWSYASLIRIAVGIFFLGVQIFHISLWLVLLAQFQWLHDLLRGKLQPVAEKWVVGNQNAAVYPTLPAAHYPASSPSARRDGYYQTQAPSHQNSYSTYDGRYQ